jgi:hypothetical protein
LPLIVIDTLGIALSAMNAPATLADIRYVKIILLLKPTVNFKTFFLKESVQQNP